MEREEEKKKNEVERTLKVHKKCYRGRGMAGRSASIEYHHLAVLRSNPGFYKFFFFCSPMILVALNGGTLLKKRNQHNLLPKVGAWIRLSTLAFKQHRYPSITRSTRSSHAVTLLSSARSQCCLTSEFEWEFVYPTLHGLWNLSNIP